MRRAKNGAWIIENGKFFGISTGFEFAAEHECGMKSLQNSAGIDSLNTIYTKNKKKWYNFKKYNPVLGLDRTTILNKHNVMQGTFEMEDGYEYYAFGYNVRSNNFTPPDTVEDILETYWDDTSFLIISNDKEKMTMLVDACYNKDLAFTTGGKVLNDHAGIRLVIKSKTPQHIIDACKTDDSKALELKLYDDKYKVQDLLRKNGCDFYACSIHWKDYDKKEVQWWLNPQEQHSYESGYCSLEDLKDWTKGKGKVIKTK